LSRCYTMLKLQHFRALLLATLLAMCNYASSVPLSTLADGPTIPHLFAVYSPK